MRTPAERITQFSKQEIDRLFQTSTCQFKNNAVTLLAAPRSKGFARMLLVVPKATGNAVVRNKLRRRLKDIFRREALSQKLPVDLVVIARKPIMDCSFDELKQLINTVVKKVS